jgi:chemotaxis protein MotB
MKKVQLLIFTLTLLVTLESCAPVHRCGELRPVKVPITWSKNLKTVVRERDFLCISLADKEKENTGLKNNISELTDANKDLTDKYNNLTISNKELQNKYKNLIDENLSQTDQFNKALSAKSDELNNKEKLLSDREKALEEMQLIIHRQDSITKRLNSILRNALLGFNSDELSVEIKNGSICFYIR